MELYFLRHGLALSRAEWSGSDPERPLTDRGRRITHEVTTGLARLGLKLDVIVTSPYARALETAQIAAEDLHYKGELEVNPLLKSGFSAKDLGKIVKAHADAKRIMLVGHEPDFSEVVSELVGGGYFIFKKSGVALVELEAPGVLSGQLRWLISPDVFARA